MNFRLNSRGPKWLWIILLAPLLVGACSAQSASVAAPQSAAPAQAVAQAPAAPTSAPATATTAAPTAQPTTAPAVAKAQSAAPTVPTTTPPATAMTPAKVQPTQAPAQPAAPTTQAVAQVQCKPGALTPAQTEGPYYKANPPQRDDLLDTTSGGTKVIVTGYVLTADCKPIANARVDFWQADAQGQYDNRGYTLRGYQVSDANGQYRLETVIPGLYPGRTRHIHVKITPPNGATLTTQLYFPGEAANTRDGIFDQRLLASVQDTGDGKLATYNFVLNTK